ncbi:MAG: type I-B CRISPR-associated protein Cas5b [Bacteroidales bacterium]
MEKLISIDLFADLGMLKKPDTNDPVYLTFNMLHKPALLGIVGAIIGEQGFKENKRLPDYYLKLKDLKVSIQPLDPYHEKGNYKKTVIVYNNTTGMASREEGGNLMIKEQTLISPAYRCYFLLELQNPLHEKIDSYLKNYRAEYLPYLGKNEFSVWWMNYNAYSFDTYEPNENFKISSIFIKDEPVSPNRSIQPFIPNMTVSGNTFLYFERLPYAYDEKLFQYEYRNFAFTDWSLKKNYSTSFVLLKISTNEIIQVF